MNICNEEYEKIFLREEVQRIAKAIETFTAQCREYHSKVRILDNDKQENVEVLLRCLYQCFSQFHFLSTEPRIEDYIQINEVYKETIIRHQSRSNSITSQNSYPVDWNAVQRLEIIPEENIYDDTRVIYVEEEAQFEPEEVNNEVELQFEPEEVNNEVEAEEKADLERDKIEAERAEMKKERDEFEKEKADFERKKAQLKANSILAEEIKRKKAEFKAAELKAAELEKEKAAELKAAELKAAELKAAEFKAAELKAAELEKEKAQFKAAELKAAELEKVELKKVKTYAEQAKSNDFKDFTEVRGRRTWGDRMSNRSTSSESSIEITTHRSAINPESMYSRNVFFNKSRSSVKIPTYRPPINPEIFTQGYSGFNKPALKNTRKDIELIKLPLHEKLNLDKIQLDKEYIQYYEFRYTDSAVKTFSGIELYMKPRNPDSLFELHHMSVGTNGYLYHWDSVNETFIPAIRDNCVCKWISSF
jgi:hypothetical protein